MDFNTHFLALKEQVDDSIQKYIFELESSMGRPGLVDLYKSMKYSLASGGHRMRPVLSLLTAEAFGRSHEEVLSLGIAVELIHTYSLIHDDLPAMDDDEQRRGQPSNHKVFGEALAVLSGDALNTEAFFVLAKNYSTNPKLALDLIMDLALAAGASGMVGGQAIDVVSKGRSLQGPEVEFLHTYKTGALFKVSILGAARICDANAFQLKSLSDYARNFGLLFQIADDIKDGHKSDEPSFVKSVGLEKAKETCTGLVQSAELAVESFGEKAASLKGLVHQVYKGVSNPCT